MKMISFEKLNAFYFNLVQNNEFTKYIFFEI